MTFIELLEKFPTEKSVVDYYLKIRYGDKVACNHCGSTKVYQRKAQIKLFNCKDCDNTFSPFKGTIFEKSSTDLRKWMYAIHLFLNGKNGISGMQLMRETGVTYKTAWRMLQQIRLAMGNAEQQAFVDTIIEMDETYIGGKPRKNNDQTPTGTSGRGTKKSPVVGVVDRENKKIYAKVAMPDENGKRLTSKQLFSILSKVCKKDSNNKVITDEYNLYSIIKQNNIVHLRIDHKLMFANGPIHTNNIESFWATLKRGIYGIYHHVSVNYLQRYVDEFCFRYNNRHEDMFKMVLEQSVVK